MPMPATMRPPTNPKAPRLMPSSRSSSRPTSAVTVRIPNTTTATRSAAAERLSPCRETTSLKMRIFTGSIGFTIMGIAMNAWM
jgi:hypothetical protein